MHIKSFKEITGQERAMGFLKRIAINRNFAHAYLFAGIPGIGKMTTALAFALSINCRDSIDGVGCEKCESCKRLMDGNHPDIVVAGPEKGKKTIGIDQIKEINREISYPPAMDGYRIIIVDQAEKMTDEAANAFLKTLEEPPSSNIHILIIRDPGELLATIVSRCQKVPFSPLSPGDIKDLLTKNSVADGEMPDLLARYSEGSIGRATALAEGNFLAQRIYWLDMLDQVLNGPPEKLVDSAQNLSVVGKGASEKKMERDEKVSLVLGMWKAWYRDMLVLKLEPGTDLIFNSDLVNRLKEASERYSAEAIMHSLSVIARAEYDLINNKNMLFLIERSMFELKKAVNN